MVIGQCSRLCYLPIGPGVDAGPSRDIAIDLAQLSYVEKQCA